MIKLLVITLPGQLASLRHAIEASDLTPVQVVERSPDSLEGAAEFDCILVDAELGARSGLDVVRDLRTGGLTAPIIIVSADATDETLEASVAAGVTDFLTKSDITPRRVAMRVRFAVRITEADVASRHAAAAVTRSARVRDEILAIVSHDLRSPLHAIGLACEALRGQPEQTGTRYIAAIERAAQRAERLITDLLEASAIENGAIALHVHPIDAAAVVRQAAADHELLVKETKASIDTAVPSEPTLVAADRDRVLQVLGNLIGNALKHARGTPIELRLERLDGEARIAVRDHGPGISDLELPHVFDRYWTGRDKRGGSGLGLAIAKGIVDAHGGKLAVTSRRNEGAEFAFTLPLATR
jgi:signal transduction histidine kinase